MPKLKICFWPGLENIDIHPASLRISGFDIIRSRLLQSFTGRVEIIQVPEYPAFSAPLEEIFQIVNKADIVVTLNLNATINLLLIKAIYKLNRPAFYSLTNNPHEYPVAKILIPLLFSVGRSDYFITGTRFCSGLYRNLNNRMGLYPSYPVGIPAPTLLEVDKEPNFLTYQGRIASEKGLLSLLMTLNSYKNTGGLFKLNLIGQVETPEYYDNLQIFLESSLIKKDVIFHGPLSADKSAEILAATDIFLSFSVTRGENLGLAPLEAMSYGAIPLLSRWDGYREIVPDEKNLVPVQRLSQDFVNVYGVDIHQALKRLQDLISLPADVRAAMRDRARTQAGPYYTEVVSQNFLNFVGSSGQISEPLFDRDKMRITDLREFVAPEIFPLIFPPDSLDFSLRDLLFKSANFQKYLQFQPGPEQLLFFEDFMLRSFYK